MKDYKIKLLYSSTVSDLNDQLDTFIKLYKAECGGGYTSHFRVGTLSMINPHIHMIATSIEAWKEEVTSTGYTGGR